MKFAQLKSRVLVAVIGAPVIIVCVLIGKLPFLILFSVILLLSLREFYLLAQQKEIYPDFILSIFTALLLMWDMYFYWGNHFLPIIAIYLVVTSIFQLGQTQGSQIKNLSASFWGVGYLGVLLSFFIAIRQLPPSLNLPYKEGGYWLLTIKLAIWTGDSIAYFLGSSFGKHKLASRISPKKTVEGAVGGFISMVLIAVALKYLFHLSWSFRDALAVGIICGIFAQISDLVESQFKRDAGVKDTSNILPGHGGIFDRFDTLFLTSPLLFFYFKYFSSMLG